MTIAPIDCLHAMRELWDYLDKQLPSAREAQIRTHLATCDGCRAHVEFCRAFLVQIDTAPVGEAELSSMRRKVFDALNREQLTTHRAQ